MSYGSPRSIWNYIYKTVAQKPSISFNEFYQAPVTQHYLREFFHLYGYEKAEERVYGMFKDIKESYGYEEVEEEVDIKKPSLASQVQRARRNEKKVQNIVESIIKNKKTPKKVNRYDNIMKQLKRF